MPLDVRAAQTVNFWEKLHKAKIEECHLLSRGGSGQIRSQTSPSCLVRGLIARAASAGMISWQSEMKLGR